jgi:hypothetical protein
MFIPTLKNQTTDEQKKLFLEPALAHKIIGCYAQTEVTQKTPPGEIDNFGINFISLFRWATVPTFRVSKPLLLTSQKQMNLKSTLLLSLPQSGGLVDLVSRFSNVTFKMY